MNIKETNILISKLTDILANSSTSRFIALPEAIQFFDDLDGLLGTFSDSEKDSKISEVVTLTYQVNAIVKNRVIPIDKVHPSSYSETLWSVYNEVLKKINILNETNIISSEKYNDALKVLYINSDDNILSETEQYKKYKEFSSHLYSLKQKAVDLSTDKNDATQLNLINEQIQKIEIEIKNEYSEIEKSIICCQSHHLNSLSSLYNLAKRKLDSAVILTNPDNNIEYYETSFIPSSIIKDLPNQSIWMDFVLTDNDIKNYSDEDFSSNEVKSSVRIFNHITSNSKYKHTKQLSFKYITLGIQRNWFHEDIFKNSLQLNDDTVISDSKTLSKGELPSYITAVIIGKDFVHSTYEDSSKRYWDETTQKHNDNKGESQRRIETASLVNWCFSDKKSGASKVKRNENFEKENLVFKNLKGYSSEDSTVSKPQNRWKRFCGGFNYFFKSKFSKDVNNNILYTITKSNKHILVPINNCKIYKYDFPNISPITALLAIKKNIIVDYINLESRDDFYVLLTEKNDVMIVDIKSFDNKSSMLNATVWKKSPINILNSNFITEEDFVSLNNFYTIGENPMSFNLEVKADSFIKICENMLVNHMQDGDFCISKLEDKINIDEKFASRVVVANLNKEKTKSNEVSTAGNNVKSTEQNETANKEVEIMYINTLGGAIMTRPINKANLYSVCSSINKNETTEKVNVDNVIGNSVGILTRDDFLAILTIDRKNENTLVISCKCWKNADKLLMRVAEYNELEIEHDKKQEELYFNEPNYTTRKEKNMAIIGYVCKRIPAIPSN